MRLYGLLALAAAAPGALAQYGFGVNSGGTLFRFELANPSVVTNIGPVGFVPEGIDFRPGTTDLYALDVGASTTQMYRINVNTGAATMVGGGFANTGSSGANSYNLGGGQTFGFDFNPTTLQADNSMRIRLISSGGSNLRLHSATGGVAAIDGTLSYGAGAAQGVEAAAYINSAAGTAGGTTALYVMDYINNQMALQSPPNNGTLTAIGAFGAGINNTMSGIGFDILTDPLSVDPGIGGDTGYAVLRRPDAPVGGPLGAYLLYNVNLSNGSITGGSLVGGAGAAYDFSGGFAVNTMIPAPGAAVIMGLAAAVAARRRR